MDEFFRKQVAGLDEEVHQLVREQIEKTIESGLNLGVKSHSLREYSYLMERLRRWGRANRSLNVINPLVCPAFIRAAFTMDSEQRMNYQLHQFIIAKLIPQWKDLPLIIDIRRNIQKATMYRKIWPESVFIQVSDSTGILTNKHLNKDFYWKCRMNAIENAIPYHELDYKAVLDSPREILCWIQGLFGCGISTQ